MKTFFHHWQAANRRLDNEIWGDNMDDAKTETILRCTGAVLTTEPCKVMVTMTYASWGACPEQQLVKDAFTGTDVSVSHVDFVYVSEENEKSENVYNYRVIEKDGRDLKPL